MEVKLFSFKSHLSQILTGFFMLPTSDYDVVIEDCRNDRKYKFKDQALMEVIYKGKHLVFDTMDGYNQIDAMKWYLERCDYYFKRSFSAEKNKQFFESFQSKIKPLGFNYHLTFKKNPMDSFSVVELLKNIMGVKSHKYFTQEVFEETPQFVEKGDIRIIFYTRLWEKSDQLSDTQNQERKNINNMRIELVRKLKVQYGNKFSGGISDSKLARKLAPDLISPAQVTIRSNYLKKLHESDICVGTMGLHESIGWKTGEYVAAAKAIVNERFRYLVPGDFEEGKNYLEFTSCEECIQAVNILVNNPDKVFEMKKANKKYYDSFLRPDILVKNALDIAK